MSCCSLALQHAACTNEQEQPGSKYSMSSPAEACGTLSLISAERRRPASQSSLADPWRRENRSHPLTATNIADNCGQVTPERVFSPPPAYSQSSTSTTPRRTQILVFTADVAFMYSSSFHFLLLPAGSSIGRIRVVLVLARRRSVDAALDNEPKSEIAAQSAKERV